MIVETIELEHVGAFRGKASIGPLQTGINVLAAPNETGKSTFLRAAARALFDKHTCKDDEIRSLQPTGSDLAPKIAVVFEHAGTRYRVVKRFLNNPESQFNEWRGDDWQLMADGDAADERVQRLLQSSVPGRGSTKAAHWGMLGFLWARQGEASEWPSWEDDTGKVIKSRLARVEIDPVIDQLREKLWESYAELFTNTGKAKARGVLDQLETELQKLEADKEQVKQQRLELESLHRQFAELGPRLASLEEEMITRKKEAEDLRAQATAAEVGLQELQRHKGELDVAKEKLETVNADIEQLGTYTKDLAETKSDLARAIESLNDATIKENAAKQRVIATQQELDAATARAKQLSEQKERVANLLKLKDNEKKSAAMEKLAKKAAAQQERLRSLQAQFEKLPNITPAKLKKLQELNESIRQLDAKLEAIGLSVEIKPDIAAKLTVTRGGETEKLTLKAGANETVHAPQSLDLQLSGWGQIRIRSGATELKALQEQVAKDRETLREQLAAVDCVALGDAETAVTRRRDLQKEIETVEEKLDESLEDFESLEELQSKRTALERQTKAMRDTLAPNAAETKASVVELEADVERFSASLKKEQDAQSAATRELKKQRDNAEELGGLREQAGKQEVKLKADVTAIEQQIATLQGRYPQSSEKAKGDAQKAFVTAEARHDEAKRKLPPDADKLQDRSRRAARAFEDVRADLDNRRRDFNKLEGALQTRGSEGLYSKLSSLEEREASLRQQIERLRDRGWAARLAHDLIEFRKQAATRAVLGPLEARLSGTFSEISRDTERRVFLDEQLQISGVGTNREAMIGFAHLSQGAKEQLLLCLRLAVAGEVSTNGHKLVVLDDVLVNTDGQRQQRVLDLLQTVASQLQILILTCHPERYRGVGTVVEIRSD